MLNQRSTMESYIKLPLLSVFVLICIQTFLSLKKAIFKKHKLPPGPIGLPIIGNLLAIGDRPHESLTKLAKFYGPLMTVQLGFNTTVVATSIEMAKEILQKHDQSFLGRPLPHAVTAERNYHRSVAWLSAGPKWRSLRKICNSQIFTIQRLDQLQGLMHQMMEGMIRRVKEASEAKEGINVGRLVFATTLNSLSNTIFSVDILDPKSNAVEELKVLIGKIMELAGKPNLADYFPFLKPLDPQGIKREIKVSYDRLHELMDGMIGRRLERRECGSERCDDFLEILIDEMESKTPGGQDQFDREDINILLADLFIGGTDTTTTTMEWVMAELLHNPNIMAKANQELKQTIGSDQSLEEKHIPQLPYLQSILKETMRLHSTVPLLLPHLALADTQICGYTIPKNTQVFVNAWALARDPTYWTQPTEFIPERSMELDADFRGTNFYYLPFSSGRRICPGVSLGVRMMCLTLATLIHHFDWNLPDGVSPQDMDMHDKFGITLQKATPLIATPVTIDV